MTALTTVTVGWVIFTLISIGWITYFFLSKSVARRELGSEAEVAPNRKVYYDDDKLEGSRLERMQFLGVLMLITMVIGLPLYWVLEPGRQAGAVDAKQAQFRGWGEELFATTADGGFNCAGCHGGMSGAGAAAPYPITDTTGKVTVVSWYAPALNTIFYRYSQEEVRFILNYGRPFSPMPAWGAPGGGPMTEQNIETLLVYMKSIQLPPEGCITDDAFVNKADPFVCDGGVLPQATRDDIQAAVERYQAANPGASEGEALFNLDIASGAYSCARCHTPGWSYGQPGVDAQGAFGWNLTGGATNTHFASEQDMITFIKAGSKNGARYGVQSQGTGRMPGFGHLLSDEQIKAIVEYVRGL
ncbi:MAG: c-type cytochrome [Actinobacteria bacterium]|nr:c-type cytochrome [Actinomycetota bacterium]